MIPAYFDTSDFQKRLMYIVTFFIAYPKTSVLMQPRNGSLSDPAICPQTTAIFSPTLSKQRDDFSYSKLTTVWLAGISPVSHCTLRPFYRPANFTCDRGYAVNQWNQLRNIMTVCLRQCCCQRNPISIGYQMMFRTFFTAICGIWAGLCPPKTARTDEESKITLEKSILSAPRNLLNNTWCILSQTPAFCQSRSLRQQVIPLPQPISWGRSSQPIPVFRTNKMPVNAALSEIGLRPGYRKRLFFFGINGSIISHNSSVTIGFAMGSILALTFMLQLPMLSAIYLQNLSLC